MRRRDKENIKIQGPIAATLLDRAIFLTTEKRSLRNAAKFRHTPTHDDLANVRAIDAEKRITRGLHRLVLVHFDASASQAGVTVIVGEAVDSLEFRSRYLRHADIEIDFVWLSDRLQASHKT